MYGIPLPDNTQPAQAAGQTSQGVPTQAAKPQWGGQGYMNQYQQQRQQMQQQMSGLQRPNAPMPNGMAAGGLATMPAAALQPPTPGALNFAAGGQAPSGQPKSMQDVPQAATPTAGVPSGSALVPHAGMAASPLTQSGAGSGIYTPQNYQALLASAPQANQISDWQRGQGIMTVDRTPQYLSTPNGPQQRQVNNALGPQGQLVGSLTAPPPGPAPPPIATVQPNQTSAANDINAQLEALIGQKPFMADGGAVDQDFTGGGQPLDYNAGRKRDTIPAQLDHGEWVMTRKAVKGAGGGDIRQGARVMGALMRKFEQQT